MTPLFAKEQSLVLGDPDEPSGAEASESSEREGDVPGTILGASLAMVVFVGFTLVAMRMPRKAK